MSIKFFDDLYKKAQEKLQPPGMQLDLACVERLNPTREEQVAARLAAHDDEDRFSWYVCASMKARPWEWEVSGQKAIHKRGVVVEVSGDRRNLDAISDSIDSRRGYVMSPSSFALCDESRKDIAAAFDFLSKVKVLGLLRVDNFEERV